MRIIGETHIPFLTYRRIALGLSLLVIVAGVAYELLGPGLNLGIDFVGGTQVTVKFQQSPDLGELRSSLADLGAGEPVIQRFDELEKHEILIRVQNPSGTEGDFTQPILDHLEARVQREVGSRFDLNTQGSQELTDLLVDADPDAFGADPEQPRAALRPDGRRRARLTARPTASSPRSTSSARSPSCPTRSDRTSSRSAPPAPSRCSAPRASAPRSAPTCARRRPWRSSSRSSACWSTSGSGSSFPTASAQWPRCSTTC